MYDFDYISYSNPSPFCLRFCLLLGKSENGFQVPFSLAEKVKGWRDGFRHSSVIQTTVETKLSSPLVHSWWDLGLSWIVGEIEFSTAQAWFHIDISHEKYFSHMKGNLSMAVLNMT